MPTPNDDRQHGTFHFSVPIEITEFKKGHDRGKWTMTGHAAVFNRRSHDLGGFRTVIASGAFVRVLDQTPDVHLVREHDMRQVLARTKNGSLDLREDPYGLHVYAKFGGTTHAENTAIEMADGLVDQMSFACDIDEDEWVEDKNGDITRTIFSISALYDVSICAQGAFPQTNSQLVASLKDAGADLASALEAGRVIRRENPELAATHRSAEHEGVAHESVAAEGEAHESAVANTAADEHSARLSALRESTEARYAQHTQPR